MAISRYWVLKNVNYWNIEAKRTLKALLARKGVSHKVLAARLSEMGVPITEAAVASKLSRGTFTFGFVLQVAAVVGIDRIDVAAIDPAREV